MKKTIIFLVTTLSSVAVFAQDATAQGNAGLVALGVGIAMGLAVLGAALAQGKAASAALEGIARNPAASDKIMTPLIVSLALIESLVLIAFAVTFVGMLSKNFGF